MTWTAKLQSARKQAGQLYCVISYTDGTEVLEKSYQLNVDDEAIKRAARNGVTQLENADNSNITLIEGTDIDLTPPAVVPPTPLTPEEIARNAWFTDFDEFLGFHKLDTYSLLRAQDNARLNQLRTSLAADYLPEYLDGID